MGLTTRAAAGHPPCLRGYRAILNPGRSLSAGSDILVIRYLEPITLNLANNMMDSNDQIAIPSGKITFKADDIVFISDCEESDIFKATNGTSGNFIKHSTASNTTDSLSKAFQTDAQVGRLQTVIYYIKDTGRVNETNQPILSLYRQMTDGSEEEVIPGVENMQVEYGLDTTGDNNPDTYATADLVDTGNNWHQVRSVKLVLLHNSIEEVSPDPIPYIFNGVMYTTPTDRVIRKQWMHYINLRNRTL